MPATETATWPAGDYCFVFNPGAGDNTPAGEYNVRLISQFTMNTPPIADPNGPYVEAVNTAISFDGNGSSDPDGDPLTYAWDFGDGNRSGERRPHLHGTGIYDVCLTVNDGNVDSAEVCTTAVVYDPAGGFVTGGGWIYSPAGDYSTIRPRREGNVRVRLQVQEGSFSPDREHRVPVPRR